MRLLVLLLALLAACPGAQAQLVPVATPTVLNSAAAPAPALAAPDTAAALHRLFAQRRHKSHRTLRVGGALLLGAGLTAATAPAFKEFQGLGVLAVGALAAASSVPVLATGLINKAAFSRKREQRTLLAWQQHRLPRPLKRMLEDDSLLTAQAQLARAAVLGPIAATAAARDTAVALHRLFAAKRRMLRILLPLTAAVGVGLVPVAATQPASSGSAGAVLLGTTTLVLAAGEVAVLRKYSRKHEARALLALKEHRLPAPQRQELKAEYFRPAKATP